MDEILNKKLKNVQEELKFSGTVLISDQQGVIVEQKAGFANRSDQIRNEMNTRFGIASGCKIFTAVAICQLVQAGKLSFETNLKDCLDIEVTQFSADITIHQLLTHTSGVPDYFDEEVMDDFEELWEKTPMYLLHRLRDFLPLFQHEEMKFQPGERFHYNNAGYILLGLVIESVSDQEYHAYVEEHIFAKAGMHDSGYFSFDALPGRTALGYIDGPDGSWRTNQYALPVRGGSDGGAFVTAGDMNRFWEALLTNQLLSEPMTEKLLVPYAQDEEGSWYGYGVWMEKRDETILVYHVMGYDPGVNFRSGYYPTFGITAIVCSNGEEGAEELMDALEEYLMS
ncbi:serine hydrolase domain-containing protein [Lentibacillus sediminis]|uniref:serine hydrolase domain-containing protein n=1 Tax=Lentibacillus sediminis TaxID=1940529 RepID=UPI000C1C4699|nr:serine hydrolase [Lentibacillus sediminis]